MSTSTQQAADTEKRNTKVSGTSQDVMEIDLVELFYRLIEKIKLIIAFALLGALLAGIYSWFIAKPVYQSTSMLYILNNDNLISLSDLQIGSNLTGDYVTVFSIWENQETVIKNLKLPYSNKQLGSMVNVTNPAGTRFVNITVTSSKPQEAADIANEMADVVSKYIAKNMTGIEPSRASAATPNASPVSPKKTRNVIIGFLLGTLLAAAIVTIQFILDTKIKTADDVRKVTGLPTLAVIPWMAGDENKNT